MSWEDFQPHAVMRRAREAKRRERDAAMNQAVKPTAGERLSREWQRPVIQPEPSPESLLNRQERILTEIRDAIAGKRKTKRGKR